MSFHTRTLSNGNPFDVVTLPKGTVLFHGFNAMYDEDTVSEYKLFTELFGDASLSGGYCLAPTAQKFFYPAPFMGDIVDRFQLYGVFVLNYDTPLVSMARPSSAVHKDKGSLQSATVRCDRLDALEASDVCGIKHTSFDHCLTPAIRSEHPDIQGYIAIPNNDGPLFKTLFHAQLHKNYPEYVDMTTPMVVSNATGLSAIPEIVIHPIHARTSGAHYISGRAVDDPVRYILANKSKLNFVPIMYFSERNSFSLLDLSDSKLRMQYLKTMRNETYTAITPIHVRIKTFIDNALSPTGVLIHDMLFKITIDMRTGFYIAKYTRVESPMAVKNIKVFNSTEDASYDVIPFEYPEYLKKRLHGLLGSHTRMPIDKRELSNFLARHKASYNAAYIFDKGKSRLRFQMETAFPFPDRMSLRNKTRKRAYLKRHTHGKTMKRKKVVVEEP